MPKRISDQKAAQFASALAESENTKRRRTLVDSIKASLNKADEGLLLAVQALIQGRGGSADGAAFPRGVSRLAGPTPGCVPQYMKIECVVAVNKGVGKSQLEQLDKSDVDALFLWGVGKPWDFPIPTRKMLHSDFVSWYTEKHDEAGKPIANVQLSDEPLDWNLSLGAVCLAASTGEEDPTMFDSVKLKSTGEIVKLPRGLKIEKSEVGTTWRLNNNTSLESAALEDADSGDCIRVAKLFKAQALRSDSEAGTPKKNPVDSSPVKVKVKAAPSQGTGNASLKIVSPKADLEQEFKSIAEGASMEEYAKQAEAALRASTGEGGADASASGGDAAAHGQGNVSQMSGGAEASMPPPPE